MGRSGDPFLTIRSAPDLPDYAALFRTAPSCVVLVGESEAGWRVLDATNALVALLGLSRAAVVGRWVGQVFLGEVALSLTGALDSVRMNPRAVTFETVTRVADGEARRLDFKVRRVNDDDGGQLLVRVTRRDAEAGADDRSSGILLEQLEPINAGAVYVYDIVRERGVYARSPLTQLLGYPAGAPASLSEPSFSRLVHPSDLHLIQEHRRTIMDLADAQQAISTCRLRHAQGGWRWIEMRERVLNRDRDGRVRRILGVAYDVSDRHMLADALAGASKALLTAESHERQRIARELHDSTAQHLVAIDLTLARLERRPSVDPMERSILKDIRTALSSAHREIRTFSYLLHPPHLERAGLHATLEAFVLGFAKRSGLAARLKLIGAARRLPPACELALMRVAQEALMNAHKHALATVVELRLEFGPGWVTLEVEDDGVGLRQHDVAGLVAEGRAGVGVLGMKARMEGLNGTLELAPGQAGLLVRARLGDVARAAPGPTRARRPRRRASAA